MEVAGLVAFQRLLGELVVHFKEWTTGSENNVPLKMRKKKPGNLWYNVVVGKH